MTISKIALEEHVTTPHAMEYWDSSGEAARNGRMYSDYIETHLLDVDLRLALMDDHHIERQIVSLTSPGIQSIASRDSAVHLARQTNDIVHDRYVHAHPDRFSMFACLPTQDPDAAAAELRRAVTELGAVGALVNGYTDGPNGEAPRYLDHESFAPLWEEVASLGVPFYLHPREPQVVHQSIYDGYSSLVGSAWGFGHETATHAVRLMLSGLFDVHPEIQLILGHLGEGLPFLLPRLEHRLEKQREGEGLGEARRPVSDYFSNNFHLTSSGHFHTRTLQNAIAEIGVERVMFSVDFPYESIEEAADWFDAIQLAPHDLLRIGRTNALQLFGLPD